VSGSANGGLTLEAYELLVDNGLGGEFGPVNDTCQPSLQTSYLLTNLTKGRVYRLKYRVQNYLGWSPYSPVASLLAAGVP
jgi:hypothetical protein